jgi:adenylate cyclase
MGDAFLRLKEYGVKAAVCDIEYIDKSPSGLDELYYRQGLRADFERSFINIDSYVSELFGALEDRRISLRDALEHAGELSELINSEKNDLFARTNTLARDNDAYLASSSRLFGHTWGTLNLQNSELLGEQARRRLYAEEHFSYPVQASGDAAGGGYTDVLSAIPQFAESAEGAGFTNVFIDSDGVRRRIALTRKVGDHWYLQLAFAPLVSLLGSPAISLEKGRLTLHDARLPGGAQKDISIPLDQNGHMLLDWPKTDYFGSYDHLSFADFSELEESESNLYGSIFNLFGLPFWTSLLDDPFYYETVRLLADIIDAYETGLEARRYAVNEGSEEAFGQYVELMALFRNLSGELLDSGAAEALAGLLKAEVERNPESARELSESIVYIETNFSNIGIDYANILAIREHIEKTITEKICVVGRVDTGTTDIGVNPFSGEYVNVGTHAVVLDTILSQSFLVWLPSWYGIIITLVLVPLVIFLIGNLSATLRTLFGFAAALAFVVFSLLLFNLSGLFLAPLIPALALISAVIVREVIAFIGSEREKNFIRRALSTYTSPDVANLIVKDPSVFVLGGDRRNMTAIFTDVRSFSTISEALKDPETGEADPKRLVSLLNVYLTRMSDPILSRGGTIDKYEGDAIIAFFGAPIRLDEHAYLACDAAVAMRKAEIEFNREAKERGFIDEALLNVLLQRGVIQDIEDPNPIRTRMGINTGDMVVGNMGTEKKFNYTIMGNAVNIAARLEGVNKQYGTWILATENTIKNTNNAFLTRQLDRVRVVGISEAVQLYEIIETRRDAGEARKALVDRFHEALAIYKTMDFKKDERAFAGILEEYGDDGPSRTFMERCKTFITYPPEPGWDGVLDLREK